MVYPALFAAGTGLPLLVLLEVFPGWGIAPALRAFGWGGQQIGATLVHWLL